VVSLDPASGKFGPNSIFEEKITLTLDPGECVNAGQFIVDFPNDVLEVKDFDTSESVFSLWIKKPSDGDFIKINQIGKLSLMGGLPGGFCGATSVDQYLDTVTPKSVIIGSIIFSIKKPITSNGADIGFSSLSQIFLNNDRGEEAKISFQNSHLDIDESLTSVIDQWKEKLDKDKTPPEPFTVEIGRDENIFNGQYFLSFSTVDKQTGIDHYEVLEISPADYALAQGQASVLSRITNKILGHGLAGLNWQVATSPYLLQDQTLKNMIKVKAVDKAGNERIVDFIDQPLYSSSYTARFGNWIFWIETAIIVILLALLAIVTIRCHRHKRKK